MIGRYAFLFLVGIALQLMMGNVDASFLTYPWTICLVVNYLYLQILMYFYADKYNWIKTLYDRPAYLSSLFTLLVLTLFFGLIPQNGSTEGVWGMLGFTKMSSSWIFVLFLLHFITVLGMKVIEDVHHWRKRKIPVVLMHVACYVILLSSILSSGEKIRIRVTTALNVPVSIGVTETGKMFELPFTLMLKKFVLEEYPPQIHLIDGKEQVIPRREVKKFVSIVAVTDENGTKEVEIMVNHPVRIGDWRIYQSGYDSARGKQSTISILECVQDSWYPIIHVAMWIILVAGVLMMFGRWTSRRQKKEEKA